MTVNVVAPARRMYPVIFLLDASGSMADDGKSYVLDAGMAGAIEVLRSIDDPDVVITTAIITFGTQSQLHTSLTPVEGLVYRHVPVGGSTSLGGALVHLLELLSGGSIPATAFPPTIVLVSDGHPTDDYVGPLDRLRDDDQFKSALKLAIRIGADCEEEHLRAFAGSPVGVFTVSELTTLSDLLIRTSRAVENDLGRSTSSRRARPGRLDPDE